MSITEGQRLPDFERTITLPAMIAYAGATWDWHRLHYDRDYLAAKKLPAPVVDGQLFGALFVEQAQDWLGPRAFVRRMKFRFSKFVFADETVRCTGTVTAVDDNGETIVVTIESRLDVTGPDARQGAATATLDVELRP